MITSNFFLFALTLLVSCLLIRALPSEHTKNVKIVSDDANRVAKDESDNSSGSRSDEFVLPVSRYGRINERKLTGRKNDAPSTCGYESCPKPKPGMLNVHLVAHTHDDVGWLKTLDQYYYGSRGLTQKAGVQYILDSVVQSLLQDPAKRFIYVESAFFTKWWHEQDDKLKEQVKMLVNEGRLEFIGGGWSMNDEATTHYQSIIDQMTLGLRFLNDTFGECGRPRVGWQIDPFGHSREQASLFARMGFDGLFIGRLDYQDKTNRLTNKAAEMIWKSSVNLDDTDLFTGVLFNNYGPPSGFCFDILCDDEPIIDDKFSPDYNVDRRVNDFIKYVGNMSSSYRSENVLITMGEDFNYQSAHMWFKNLDKLIKYTNEVEIEGRKLFNLFYSTPSCYLKSLHEANITWPTKSDDFFPYASDPHAFWTGYFSSRPTVKRFERVGNHFLQVCKQLTATAKVAEAHFESHLTMLRKAMGVMQHHDAVTGTEKEHVASDYSRILHQAIAACGANTKSSLNQFTTGKAPSPEQKAHSSPDHWDFQFDSCLSLNISLCDTSENSDQFTVTVYNPLAHATYQHVRFPVGGSSYEVRDYRNIVVPAQMVPVAKSVKSLNFRVSKAEFELVFQATEVPALGYKSYFVSRIIAKSSQPQVVQVFKREAEQEQQAKPVPVVIGNDHLNLTFDVNGLLSEITVDGETSKLSQNFVFYKGAVGDNMNFDNRSSGAYIFRPDPKTKEKLISKEATIEVVRGDEVDEVHQVFNEWISQVVRVYKTEKFVEFEWLVGPIPVDDNVGKEIVSRFLTVMKTNGEFYTDSNGREMLKRQRNHRDTWKVDLKEAIAGNYYPVTTKIAIEDGKHRLAVLTDRAQGGSSIFDGTVELMVHRRLLHDDAFGVGEALNETAYGKGLVARGKHFLVFGAKTTQHPTLEGRERLLQNRVLVPNWLFFDNVSSTSYDDWMKKYTNIHSSIALSLPQSVYLMTFEPWKDGGFLIRFEHLLEKNEDPELSAPVRFNLNDVFANSDIDLRELTLAGNQWHEDLNRLRFKADTSEFLDPSTDEPVTSSSAPPDMEITLNPMEIKTFVMFLNPKV